MTKRITKYSHGTGSVIPIIIKVIKVKLIIIIRSTVPILILSSEKRYFFMNICHLSCFIKEILALKINVVYLREIQKNYCSCGSFVV